MVKFMGVYEYKTFVKRIININKENGTGKRAENNSRIYW